MFKKMRLENGLRVLTAPMKGTNTVTVLVMCATGSDYERDEEKGISHFLEHMFFKGTAGRPSADIIRKTLDQMGSISNAFTSHETTGYFIKVGTIHLDAALGLLADIYKNSLLDESEIEREKPVVIEEMHLDRDTPTTHIWHMWEKQLYGDQPAGRDIAGDEKTVRSFGRAGLVEYFTHQYVAGNTAVVVAGNFDESKVSERIRELFVGIRHDATREKPAVRETQSAPAFALEERKTDQTHLIVGFRGVDAFHPARYTLDMLASILGGSFSSRMFARIRDELGLAYAIFSASENYSNRGSLVSYAGVAHENLEKALGAILEEYVKIREETVSAEELGRMKDFLKGRMLMDLETSNAVASFVGGEEMLTGRPLTPDEVFAKIDAITPEDIQRVAQELLRPDRLNAVLIGPHTNPEKIAAAIHSFR